MKAIAWKQKPINPRKTANLAISLSLSLKWNGYKQNPSFSFSNSQQSINHFKGWRSPAIKKPRSNQNPASRIAHFGRNHTNKTDYQTTSDQTKTQIRNPNLRKKKKKKGALSLRASGFEIISVTPYNSLMLLSRRFVVIRLWSKIGSDRIKNPTSNPPSNIGVQGTSDRMVKRGKTKARDGGRQHQMGTIGRGGDEESTGWGIGADLGDEQGLEESLD